MGKFSQFKIKLLGLNEGQHHFDFHLDREFFDNMENTDIHGADLHVGLDVTVRHGDYMLAFHIEGNVTLLCDRCLDALEWPIDTDYNLTVRFGDNYEESDDVLIIPQSDPFLNVAYMIYETVVLAIPMKHVHPAGQCNRRMSKMLHEHSVGMGAQPEGGSIEEQLIEEMDTEDSPTDPRWDALKGLSRPEGEE